MSEQEKHFIIELFQAFEARFDARFTQLVESINRLEERISALEQRVSALEQRISALEQRVNALEERVSALEMRVSALELKVSSLEARFDALELKVDALEKKVDRNHEALKGEINLLHKVIDYKFDGRIKSVETDIIHLKEWTGYKNGPINTTA